MGGLKDKKMKEVIRRHKNYFKNEFLGHCLSVRKSGFGEFRGGDRTRDAETRTRDSFLTHSPPSPSYKLYILMPFHFQLFTPIYLSTWTSSPRETNRPCPQIHTHSHTSQHTYKSNSWSIITTIITLQQVFCRGFPGYLYTFYLMMAPPSCRYLLVF